MCTKKTHRSNIFYCVHDKLSLFTAGRKRRICTHVALSRARNPGARRARVLCSAAARVVCSAASAGGPAVAHLPTTDVEWRERLRINLYTVNKIFEFRVKKDLVRVKEDLGYSTDGHNDRGK